jgi:uncharacterized membrane protein
LKATAFALVAALLAFRFHRSLVEIIMVMAGLGIVLRLALGAG